MFFAQKDHVGNLVTLEKAPKRIVSLVPSQTELLSDLGLDKEVVGITKFCLHPKQWKKEKVLIGGTKNLNLPKIRKLNPDLIIANKEENEKSQVDRLREIAPVWTSDVSDLNSAFQMISDIGEMTDCSIEAKSIIVKIREALEAFSPLPFPKRAAYLIWENPYMTVGGDTFIHHMLKKCNFDNIFASQNRYPITTLDEIQGLNCDILLLSTEPYPFNNTHLNKIQLVLPNSKVILADGEYFSWYGSRLKKAPAYFEKLMKQLETPS